MRKILMAATAITLMMTMAATMTSCTDNEDVPVEVTDDKPFTYNSEIDNSVRPGDDFYKYALGQWLNSSNPSPSISKQIDENFQLVAKRTLTTSNDPLMVLLRSQVDEAMADDSRSVALLKERLQMLEQVETADQLYAAFATLHQLGYNPLFCLKPFLGEGKKVTNLMATGGKTVEMDTVMASKKSELMAEKVASYCQTLNLLGYSDERIAQISENATKLEQIGMDAFLVNIEMLQRPLPLTRAAIDSEELTKAMLTIGTLMGIEKDAIEAGLVVPTALNLVFQFAKVGEQPELVPVFRDYMIYNVISQDAYCVPKLTGQTDLFAILKNVLHYNTYYKYRLMVENYGYDNIYKQQCQNILDRIRTLFIQRIDKLDWMSAATKAEARRKAEAMTFYIGYPEQWDDDMTPQAGGDCLLATVTQLRQHAVQTAKKMIGGHLDDIGWDFWASYSGFTTDNAFHMRSANSLVILPAWITRPRFNGDLSEATLYAAATTFGHEFCHGFDTVGSQYDADGNSRDWWQPADKQAFQAKQQAMIEIFNQLEAYPGQNADGEKTLAENMADYGGVELALECYKQRLTEQGFKGEQFDEQIKKFFLSYAQLWKQETERSEKYLEYLFQTDDHSAPHNRINGMMRLQDDWYRLYDIKPTDKLYLEPKDRVRIW